MIILGLDIIRKNIITIFIIFYYIYNLIIKKKLYNKF